MPDTRSSSSDSTLMEKLFNVMESKFDRVLSAMEEDRKLLREILAENKELKEKNAELEKRVRSLEERRPSDITAAITEVFEREKKASNLVIYGVPETGDRSDSEIVQQVFEDAGGDPAAVVEVFRMGRQKSDSKYPRLLKVICSNIWSKRSVIRNQRDVLGGLPEVKASDGKLGKNVIGKNYSQYVRDDLTRAQLDEMFSMRKRRDALNLTVAQEHPGKEWKIIKGNLELMSKPKA